MSEFKRIRELEWLEPLPAAALIVGPDGSILAVNESFCKLSQYSRENLLGQSMEILVPEKMRAMHEHWRDVFSEEPKAREMGAGREIDMLLRDGSSVRVDVGLGPFELRSELCVIVVARPIDARRVTLNEDRLMGLSRLVAGVAHELATPLGNIRITSDTLRETVNEFRALDVRDLTRRQLDEFVDKTRESARLLVANVDRAANLLSSFKQVSVDRASNRRRTFDLAEVLEQVSWTMQPSVNVAGHNLTVDVPSGISMESAPGAIGQVVTNLIENAITHAFSEPGGQVRVQAKTIDDDLVTIRVSDNGKGIEPRIIPRVFDPFFTTKLGQGGSGLGLNIVYNIVQTLGGKIWVTSDEGASFEMVIPRVAPEANEITDGPGLQK